MKTIYTSIAFLLCMLVGHAQYPPEINLSTTNWNSYTAPTSLPGYLQPFVNAQGVTVTRISDKAIFNVGDAPQLRHSYSKTNPFNADGSIITLGGSNPFLLNGRNYAILGRTQMPELWSNVNRLKAFSFNGTTFYYRLLNASALTVNYVAIHEFSQYNLIGFHTTESTFSNDDKIFAFYGTRSGSTDCWVIVYDNLSDRVLSETRLATPFSNVNWVSVAQDGSRIVIQYDGVGSGTYQGTKSYTTTLTNAVHLTNGTPHGDLGVAVDGTQVFVNVEAYNGYGVTMTNLNTGAKTGLWYANGGAVAGAQHLSTRNLDRPGWAYLSGGEDPVNVNRYPSSLKIIAVKLDANNPNTGEFWGFHNARNGQTSYTHQAQAVPSRDGKKVLVASDWDDATLEGQRYVPVYVFEMDDTVLTVPTPQPTPAPTNYTCKVYNVIGQLVYKGKINSFKPRSAGVYIIKHDGVTERAVYDRSGKRL